MEKTVIETRDALLLSIRTLVLVICFFFLVIVILVALLVSPEHKSNNAPLRENSITTSRSDSEKELQNLSPAKNGWQAPDPNTIPTGEKGDLVRYGKELVSHTSAYLGPKGSVAIIANGMNCQNCHNQAGTKPYGINYSAVASTYPQFRPRSNGKVSIAGRINGCFERSMNGKKLSLESKEMKAIVAYIEWVGSEVPSGVKPENSGIKKLPYLKIAADPKIGKMIYSKHCQSCHGQSGQGILNAKGNEYTYPPLWGEDSYNDGAGLYRLRNFAGFVKYNMPFGVTAENTILSDEEAWHVAAFVNSQPRPHKDQSADWKDITKKPVDVPFGPYQDSFDQEQHKYGPYGPIEKALKTKIASNN